MTMLKLPLTHLLLRMAILASTIAPLRADDQTWLYPTQKAVPVIYYPGMIASESAAARYINDTGFIASTGELVACANGLNILDKTRLITGPELKEIALATGTQMDTSYHPATWFYSLFYWINNTRFGTTVYYHGDENKETLTGHVPRYWMMGFASGQALKDHKAKYDSYVELYPNDPVILFGDSQGAATTFKAVVENNYSQKDIKLVLLEAPFDSLEHTIEERYPTMHTMIMPLFKRAFPEYKPENAPIHVADRFPHHIPVAFIASRADKAVPINCTLNLVKALVDAGHPAVYLLVLKTSDHVKVMLNEDRSEPELYQGFAHALYKKLNLPHIQAYADRIQNIEQYHVTPQTDFTCYGGTA